MRILLLAAALALAPAAAAQSLETDPPCETGAPACADLDTGGSQVPASEDPTGGGQGPGVQDAEPYAVGPYLPWIVLSIVLVAALVAALGYTIRRENIDHIGRRR